MKEYIAETGGRYTYSDDILNLQEVALAFSAVFEGCAGFIVSGCEIAGQQISPGFVWLNGKIRRFEGCQDAVFPYYIYEKNSYDTVTYANEVNKRGRCNYLCIGGAAVPAMPDAVTGFVPQFIELKPDYSPRLIDRFFGKYALLLETPFAKQTLKKDLVLTGKFLGEKDIESKTAVSVANPANGYVLKNTVRENGDASAGVYLNGLPVNEFVIKTDGTFSFIKQGQEIARIDSSGGCYNNSSATTAQAGSLLLYGSHIINMEDASDEGAVNINYAGYIRGGTKFRNFNVYNGKQASVPLFRVEGKNETVHVNAAFCVSNTGQGVTLTNKTCVKTDRKLLNTFSWTDSAKETIAFIGYDTDNSFDFTLKNILGNIVIHPSGYLDVKGELRLNGTAIGNTYVTKTDFSEELAKKVNAIAGKGLSTEDFTAEYKEKLDAISSGNLTGGGSNGYAIASEVVTELSKKLSKSGNLSDLDNKATARTNLEVYSKTETGNAFLKISGNLQELVSLSADEMNGLTPEQALAKKAEKQTAVRNNLDAEKKGTGELKLTKASNLSDLPDKAAARSNISVYSKTEIDNFLKDKLSNDGAYTGEIFTSSHKTKLEAIKTGVFQGTNAQGQPINQTEGYALVSDVVKEMAKKANLLLDNYNNDQKTAVAGNLNVYQKPVVDAKFATLENLFQDFITFLVKQGKSTAEAQKTLRDKLNAPSKEDVSDTYLRKDSRLSDLALADNNAKKQACQKIGAAYADEYQTKLIDTGWLQMVNSGNNTDTSRLFIRQIGNIVCIQGVINTAKRDGSNMGGTVAVIPNQIPPPKYGLRVSYADYNDDHKYNRGSSFVIQGNTRRILLYESGWYNVNTEINFTYMT
jgi:polyhydroxyalkanoate synthesis regulator phasin